MSEEKKEGGIHIDLGLGGLLGGVTDLVEKAGKLAEAVGDQEAEERVKEIKRRLGQQPGAQEEKAAPSQATEGLGGLFSGIGKIIDSAINLKDVQESGEIDLGVGKKGHYSMGLHVRTLGGREEEGTTFGPREQKRAERSTPPAREKVQEPELEVMDEGDHLSVTGDMPGVSTEDVQFKVALENQALLVWTGSPRKYSKELELPCPVKTEGAKLSCNNGVLELRLPKT